MARVFGRHEPVAEDVPLDAAAAAGAAGSHARRSRSRLIVAGLAALALLALGEQAPAAFPVHVSIVGHRSTGEVQVSVDGRTHAVASALGGNWRRVVLEQPRPVDREYQIDGSDTTSTDDRDARLIAGLQTSWLYRVDAFLRDEESYSRWERASVVDLTSGQSASLDGPLPADFQLDADLRRPEAPARVWLVSAAGGQREGMELDRDRRNARWVVDQGRGIQPLPRWFFPERPAPFAAALLWLLGRSVVAGYVLVLLGMGLAWGVRALAGARATEARAGQRSAEPWPEGLEPAAGGARAEAAGKAAGSVASADAADVAGGDAADGRRADAADVRRGDAAEIAGGDAAEIADADGNEVRRGDAADVRRGDALAARIADLALPVWLLAAALVATEQFHQLPHILDGVSYTFQAGLFASGQLSMRAPPLAEAFKGPFQVVWEGRVFSQYPPGAAAFFALGRLVGLEWLVGPLACTVLIGATAWTARTLYGPACGLAALGLGVMSPFILFQAGSFLSHPIAAGLVALAIAAFVGGERRGSERWYAACGALLGATFLVREVAAVLVALPLGVRLLTCRRWSAATTTVAFGLPFVLLYLLYNVHQTGSPLVLPRMLFDPSDHFGFGDGIGFHTRHTLAAGLANTDELLTLLQFDLFGWPPLFALGLLAVPFLMGRAQPWDWLALGGFLAFVAAYVGYFYHGIALGPRYYFEAVPWLLLLAARGVQVLAQVARSRVVAGALVLALTLNTVLFYTPAELARRTDMSGAPGGQPLSLAFVRASLFGPQLSGLPSNALVVTDDWWVYNAALAAFNCPRLPNCDVLFALAPDSAELDRLRGQFPDRTVLRAENNAGRISVVPIN